MIVPVVAVRVAPAATIDSTLLSIVTTRIDAPTATKPPWTPPAMPVNVRRSSAITSMFRPATIVAPVITVAVVPPDGAADIESPTTVPPGERAVIEDFASAFAAPIFCDVGLVSLSLEMPSMIER